MSYALIAPASDGTIRWHRADDDGIVDAGQVADYAALPGKVASHERLIVSLSGALASTLRLVLPVRGHRALTDAARLAFDDGLAEPVDLYSFAFGPLNDAGARLVTAIKTSIVADTLEALSRAGIDPAIVTVDHALLDQPDQSNTVLYIDDQVHASLSDGGLSGEAERFSPLIAEILKDSDVLVAIYRAAVKDSGTALSLGDEHELAAFLHLSLASQTPPNFRAGAFARRRNWAGIFKGWQRAAVLMAACIGLWLLDMTLIAVKHNRSADVLYTEAQSIFRQAFPDTPIRNLRRQARQRLGDSRGASFVDLSVELSEVLADSSTVRLAGLRFGDDNMLMADLRFPDAASLEALKSKLQDRGLQVREGGNLRREGNGDYAGQLFLGGA